MFKKQNERDIQRGSWLKMVPSSWFSDSWDQECDLCLFFVEQKRKRRRREESEKYGNR